MLSKKRKFNEDEPVALGKKCSVVVLNNLSVKVKDRGSFYIRCLIGNVRIDRALFDFGSSVSLMTYFHLKRLDLGELRPTTTSLQLSDCSFKNPLGILDDVPIKAGDLYVPVDFVILEKEKDAPPLFLGDHSWPPSNVVLMSKNSKMPFEERDDHVEFNLSKAFQISF